jgi:radical SAM protein with 4Fe4S-binding SPASM domain
MLFQFNTKREAAHGKENMHSFLNFREPTIHIRRKSMDIKKRIGYKGHDIFLIKANDNCFLFYMPTLAKLFNISSELASEISIKNISIDSNNYYIKYISNKIEEVITIYKNPQQLNSVNSNSFHLGLALTRDCTLSCIYCYAESGKREYMSKELIDAAVNYAFEKTREMHLEKVMISITAGGENTIDWDLFTYCVAKIIETKEIFKIPIYLSMTTNGYYDSDKYIYIAKYFDNINLSLDGFPNIQNRQRPTKNGEDSYLKVKNSALYFSKNIRDFIIRCTVTSLNVNLMSDIVEFFYNEFGNKYKLIFEPLVPIGRANEKLNSINEPDPNEFLESYINARENGKKFGIKVSTSGACYERLVTTYCAAMSMPSFTVTPKGIITTCERDSDGIDFYYGNYVDGKFIIDSERLSYVKKLTEIPENCMDCFCKWHCAGDCPDARRVGHNRCFLNKNIIKYELINLAKPS